MKTPNKCGCSPLRTATGSDLFRVRDNHPAAGRGCTWLQMPSSCRNRGQSSADAAPPGWVLASRMAIRWPMPRRVATYLPGGGRWQRTPRQASCLGGRECLPRSRAQCCTRPGARAYVGSFHRAASRRRRRHGYRLPSVVRGVCSCRLGAADSRWARSVCGAQIVSFCMAVLTPRPHRRP